MPSGFFVLHFCHLFKKNTKKTLTFYKMYTQLKLKIKKFTRKETEIFIIISYSTGYLHL